MVDLEYILDGFAAKYSQYYLNDISIECNATEVTSFGIDEANDKMSVSMTWACKGYVIGANSNAVILDFDAKVIYLLGFGVSGDMLTVMIEKIFLNSFLFREVDGMKIIDMKLVKIYATEMINNIYGYTVGTNFKVKSGSSKVALK